MADNIKMGKVVDGELYAGVLGIVVTCNRNSESGYFENFTQVTEYTFEQMKDACLKGYSCNLVLKFLDSTTSEFIGAYLCKAVYQTPFEVSPNVTKNTVIFNIPDDEDMVAFTEDNEFVYIHQ